MIKKIIKFINVLLTAVIFIALPVVIFTLITSKTNRIGGIQSFVVVSGSMEPSVPKGSVVYSRTNNNYSPNDVIAFTQNGRNVVHRIQEIKNIEGKLSYVTKGDANNVSDSNPVPNREVLGKTVFYIPVLGSLISFLNTLPGFLILIVTPLLIFIGFEILNIKKELERQIEDRLFKKMFTEGISAGEK